MRLFLRLLPPLPFPQPRPALGAPRSPAVSAALPRTAGGLGGGSVVPGRSGCGLRAPGVTGRAGGSALGTGTEPPSPLVNFPLRGCGRRRGRCAQEVPSRPGGGGSGGADMSAAGNPGLPKLRRASAPPHACPHPLLSSLLPCLQTSATLKNGMVVLRGKGTCFLPGPWGVGGGGGNLQLEGHFPINYVSTEKTSVRLPSLLQAGGGERQGRLSLFSPSVPLSILVSKTWVYPGRFLES